MVQNPPAGSQRIVPYFVYEDAAAVLEFLCSAFGFEQVLSFPGPDGSLMHAEVSLGDNLFMLATAVPAMGHAAPATLPGRHASVLCYVDDVDAHYAHAKAAGAEILGAPENKFYGDRSYAARDPEGVSWHFATHVRDVAPEDMVPPEA
jgi:PhnB protein